MTPSQSNKPDTNAQWCECELIVIGAGASLEPPGQKSRPTEKKKEGRKSSLFKSKSSQNEFEFEWYVLFSARQNATFTKASFDCFKCDSKVCLPNMVSIDVYVLISGWRKKKSERHAVLYEANEWLLNKRKEQLNFDPCMDIFGWAIEC